MDCLIKYGGIIVSSRQNLGFDRKNAERSPPYLTRLQVGLAAEKPQQIAYLREKKRN
jgi:hypothetical protein